jgi:hypothetical protein
MPWRGLPLFQQGANINRLHLKTSNGFSNALCFYALSFSPSDAKE